MAIAREIHAEAFAKEIQNSIDRVDAHFRRRKLYQDWKAELNTDYVEREEKLQEDRRKRMTEQFHAVLKDDLTDSLNWLLVELSGPMQSLGNLTSEAMLTGSDPSKKLSPADVALIRFGDGRVTFSAADPRILETRWPFTLRAESFSPLQKNFQSAREAVLREIDSEGQASQEGGSRLIGSVDDLMVALEAAYPLTHRKGKPKVYSEYHSGKRYLATLAREVSQTICKGDRSLFDETLRFEGDSVLELIWHMDRMGLVFAKPTSGGDRVYRSLLDSMRDLYLTQGG